MRSSDLPIVILANSADQAAVVEQVLSLEFGWTNGLTHPDIHFFNQPDDTLTIDQVRTVLAQSNYQPYGDNYQYYIFYGLDKASNPAQNALLKTIEEPPARTRIILTAERTDLILPTILSRVGIVDKTAPAASTSEPSDMAAIYTKLTSQSWSDAVTMAETYKDRPAASTFLHELLTYLHSLVVNQPTIVESQPTLIAHQQAILQSLVLLDQNVNVRLILEALFFQFKDARAYGPIKR